MIYRVDTYVVDQQGWLFNDYIADYVYNYLSQFITGLTHTEHSEDIDFWGMFSLHLPNSTIMDGMSITPAGGTACSFGAYSGSVAHNRPVRHTLIYDTNFLYYTLRDRDYGGLFNLIWIRNPETGKNYAGGNNKSGNWTTGELYKDGMVLYDLDDTTTPYTIAKMFNFAAPPGKIAVSQMQPFSKDNMFGDWTTYLHSCSTVPLFSAVSIAGDTYLAIDTNTLVKLELEE